MITLRKLSLSALAITSLLAINSVGANATVSSNALTQDQALQVIGSNLDYINKICYKNMAMSDITFVKEEESKDYGDLYKFEAKVPAVAHIADGITTSAYIYVNRGDSSLYVITVSSQLVRYDIKDGKVIRISMSSPNRFNNYDKTFYYINGTFTMNHELYYLKNGEIQTEWIYDNILDKWYYYWSTGERAHDTTVDGYYLGADGAWVQ